MAEIVDYSSWLGDVKDASKDFNSGISKIDNYLREEVIQVENDNDRRLLLYVSGDKILGFVSFSLVQFNVSIQNQAPYFTDPVLYINALGVDSQYQRNKIGSKLLEVVLRTALTIDILAPINGVRLTAYRDSTDFYEVFEFRYLGNSPERDFISDEFQMFMGVHFISELGFEPYTDTFNID